MALWRCNALRRVLAAALAAGLLLAAGLPARAHESEQYTLPAGRDFADVGPWLSRSFHAAIRDAVADTNAAIDAALAADAAPWYVESLQSPDEVAGQVWARLFAAFPAIELLDLSLSSASTRAQYPGLVTMYRPVESIYDDPLLMIDLSKLVRAFFRAGTVSAGGTLFGTDKVIHFLNLGRIYHSHYVGATARGMSPSDAELDAVRSSASNPLLSEDGVLGLFTTGIRSNGDLAADYAGLKFYRNLTEPVRLGTTLLPPMLQRDGTHWQVAVKDEDTVFTRFVSPHWNEVLNPNTYLAYVGWRVRTLIGERCEDVADWYRDRRGRPMDRAWFAARQRELATYHGEPYGHELEAEHPVSVADICWPLQPGGSVADRTDKRADRTQVWWGATLPEGDVDAMGRNALWWAAAAGQDDEVERLAASDEAVDRPDHDGETPLHAAARQGRLRAAQLLLARGADPNRAANHGVSPLLLAASGGHAELAGALLQAGANANGQDRFGRTALHEVAWRGDMAMAMLLLRHGADVTLASRHGGDARQIARRAGHEELFAALRASAPVSHKLGAADGDRGAADLGVAVSTPAGVGPQSAPPK